MFVTISTVCLQCLMAFARWQHITSSCRHCSGYCSFQLVSDNHFTFLVAQFESTYTKSITYDYKSRVKIVLYVKSHHSTDSVMYLNSYIPLCDCPHVESNCWNHVFIELTRLRQSTIILCVITIRKFV